MFVQVVAFVVAAATPVPAPAAQLGTLRQQVRRAKPELSSQPTLDDYHQSPYQPSEIVERVHGLEDQRAWGELCQELTLLADDDLELFEDENPQAGPSKASGLRRPPCWRASRRTGRRRKSSSRPRTPIARARW